MARRRPRTRRGLATAIGLGLVGGMRTMVAPATLAVRDRRAPSPLRRAAILVASTGELAADKYPKTPSRIEPASLVARFASSASVGRACAGRVGGLLGGATAIGSAFVTHRARAQLGERTAVPDAVLGAVEDSLAIAIARAITRRPLDVQRPLVVPSAPADPSAPVAPPAPPARTPPVAPRRKGSKGRRAAKRAAKQASSRYSARVRAGSRKKPPPR